MERLLIKHVKENEVLYNPKSTHYRDTLLRQRTWEKIGKELNLKAEEAKTTWDKLRRCFINARNRRRARENESGITIHPYKYENDMAFLCPYVGNNRRTLDTTKNDENTICENGDSEPEDNGKEVTHENAVNDNSTENVKAEPEEIHDDNNASFASAPYFENEEVPMVVATLGTKRDCPQDDEFSERTDFKRKCYQSNMLLEMDESDLFFMGMSKMTKSLPVLERAKVKLSVSNAVLQALISFHGNVNPSASDKKD